VPVRQRPWLGAQKLLRKMLRSLRNWCWRRARAKCLTRHRKKSPRRQSSNNRKTLLRISGKAKMNPHWKILSSQQRKRTSRQVCWLGLARQRGTWRGKQRNQANPA
jgi:hypothetical protein